MKQSKFTESQILFALKQNETCVKAKEVCRKMGVSGGTLDKQMLQDVKKKY